MGAISQTMKEGGGRVVSEQVDSAMEGELWCFERMGGNERKKSEEEEKQTKPLNQVGISFLLATYYRPIQPLQARLSGGGTLDVAL